MKIAAIYARVSGARQQQNENIGAQLEALLAYAEAHDYQVSPQHIFQDDGHSGAYLDRPALDRLRDAVAAGELEAVLIVAPDRLARQFAYQYVVTEEARACRLPSRLPESPLRRHTRRTNAPGDDRRLRRIRTRTDHRTLPPRAIV